MGGGFVKVETGCGERGRHLTGSVWVCCLRGKDVRGWLLQAGPKKSSSVGLSAGMGKPSACDVQWRCHSLPGKQHGLADGLQL